MTKGLDIAVIGGGIVGLATAYRLLQARPDLRVVVLEREPEVGLQQSSRNSGVVHAGLYYPPGSAKARWCRAGKEQLERFCAEHGVPFERRGKLVVAVDRREFQGLRALADRAQTNGVTVERVGADGLRDHEPHVRGLGGLWSPETAVTDFHAVCRALAGAVADGGGQVQTGVEVTGLRERSDRVEVETTHGRVVAGVVVACAGLQADRVANLSGTGPNPQPEERIVPIRGSWLVLRPALSDLVRTNIYPVPLPGLPFLGVHLTRRIDGQVWIGPNAVPAGARTGASPWSFDRRDLAATLGFRGSWRLAARHGGTAIGEFLRDRSVRATLREVRRYVPAIGLDDVARGPWGVRAQLVTHDGQLVDDFTVRASGRVIHVLNAPSPAATASLAIGDALRDRALTRFDG